MAYDRDTKQRYRRFRLAPDENIKLDKIRDNSADKQRKKFNIYIVLAVSVGILLVGLLVPSIASFAKGRAHSDVTNYVNKACQSYLQICMGQTVPDNTIFVVKESGSYYLLWYNSDAKANDKGFKIAEIDNPGDAVLPVNVKKNIEMEYPFNDAPIKEKNNKTFLKEGLTLLNGYDIIPFKMENELERKISKNIKMYSLVPTGGK